MKKTIFFAVLFGSLSFSGMASNMPVKSAAVSTSQATAGHAKTNKLSKVKQLLISCNWVTVTTSCGAMGRVYACSMAQLIQYTNELESEHCG